jgi:NADH-quinone oxidoreductase subunit M
MLTLFLIAWPLVSVLFTALMGRHAKWVALFSTLVQLGAAFCAWGQLHDGNITYLSMNKAWIPQFGISFNIGMDGISLLMVILASLVMPLIILSSFKLKISRPRVFFSLALVMQAAMTGVFVAQDAFLYYVFWELALVPIYFIVLVWGGENRGRVTFKFFIYTLFGSLLMLVAFIYIYTLTPDKSFSLQSFLNVALNEREQGLIFWALFLAFAIKMPVFPFHTWQPDTYVTAPSQGTMLLSGIMLKMGTFSVLRWLLPIVPMGVADWGNIAVILCIIGIVYASWIALTQNNMKRLFAYSSVAHVGLIAAGMFTLSVHGLQGSLIQALSHGIYVVGLFFVAQIIFSRTGTNDLSKLGGIIHKAPRLAYLFLVIVLGSVALPLTSGFVGEFLLLMGVYEYHPWYALFAGLTIILGATYMLRAYQRSMLGEVNPALENFKDITGAETLVLTIIAGLILFIGVYPKPILQITEPAVQALIQQVTQQPFTLK